MKAARDMHRHDRETHRERCRGDPWPGDFHHHEADDRSHQVPADERARLRRRDLRQAHHQDDRCCEWDEQEGDGRAFGQEFHRSDGDRRAGRAGNDRDHAPRAWSCFRQSCKRRSGLHSRHPKRKGGGPQGAAAR
jgi:hypothetical protein